MQVKLVFCYYILTFSKQEDYMLILFKTNLLILPFFNTGTYVIVIKTHFCVNKKEQQIENLNLKKKGEPKERQLEKLKNDK